MVASSLEVTRMCNRHPRKRGVEMMFRRAEMPAGQETALGGYFEEKCSFALRQSQQAKGSPLRDVSDDGNAQASTLTCTQERNM